MLGWRTETRMKESGEQDSGWQQTWQEDCSVSANNLWMNGGWLQARGRWPSEGIECFLLVEEEAKEVNISSFSPLFTGGVEGPNGNPV